MSIVERLRTGFDWDYSEQNIGALIQYGDLTDEAADEIERLRAELDDATLEQAWAERNAAVAELHNHKETSQAREAALREALDLLWANANHEEWDAMAREHFENLIRGWK